MLPADATIDAPAQTLTSRAWHGHWIGAPDEEDFTLTAFGSTEARPFRRVLFRTSFDVAELPDVAPARLTADSRYTLYVNGAELGHGPVRSQPRRQRYDSYELSPFLRAGRNTIAILVTYYGSATSFWQPAVVSGGLGDAAVLVFEAQLGDQWIVSDDHWRVHESEAWTTTQRSGIDGVPIEVLDARELPVRWQDAAFDDSGWPAARIRHATHIGGFGRSQPPTDPYGALLPRPIATLTGDTILPQTISRSTVRAATPAPGEHPVLRVRKTLKGAELAPQADVSLPVDVSAADGASSYVALDFGRVVAGYVHFEADVEEGAVIDVMYRERSTDLSSDSDPTGSNTGARYIARGHDDVFDAGEVNGFRYAHVLISGGGAGAALTRFSVRERLYPVSDETYFRSDDAEIDALYHAGIRTVQLNAQDAFTDCPTREQRAWVGDGVVHQMVHLTTNTDWRLAAYYVELGNSPRSDGILPMTVVGEIESSGGLTIPDWSLHWVHGAHNLFRYLGREAPLQSLLPTVERVLRWYLPYLDERGTLAYVPEWNLVDWSSVHVTGRSCILTALWARGLREFAEMSDYVGNNGNAAWARELITAAETGLEDFWDETRGTYVDHIVDGERRPAASQAAGATAIASQLAPHGRWKRIIDAITDPDALVVRSWIGSDEGGYDDTKMAEQAQGVQRIDWDADREIVLAEPFFSYVVHDAVALAGEAGLLVTLMRRWSQFLTDGFDTLGECWGWGTPVHGWSCTPTRDLITYVLGVTPGEPGFGSVRIAPALGTLGSAAGSVPTPHGLVTVEVIDETVSIDSPIPIVYVDPQGVETSLPAGTHALRR
jgi:alpha-L-rhamnosidase